MKDATKGEPLSDKTYKDVLKLLKRKNKKMFRNITKDFQDAMFDYVSDFMSYEMVPDTYDTIHSWQRLGYKVPRSLSI